MPGAYRVVSLLRSRDGEIAEDHVAGGRAAEIGTVLGGTNPDLRDIAVEGAALIAAEHKLRFSREVRGKRLRLVGRGVLELVLEVLLGRVGDAHDSMHLVADCTVTLTHCPGLIKPIATRGNVAATFREIEGHRGGLFAGNVADFDTALGTLEFRPLVNFQLSWVPMMSSSARATRAPVKATSERMAVRNHFERGEIEIHRIRGVTLAKLRLRSDAIELPALYFLLSSFDFRHRRPNSKEAERGLSRLVRNEGGLPALASARRLRTRMWRQRPHLPVREPRCTAYG